ncbi:MAG: Fe-S cluster assembly protein SufD [Gallionellaceae bacterium]|nr:Fe-S cluster assembly protein SufD [Gallionellaceae bacterium]
MNASLYTDALSHIAAPPWLTEARHEALDRFLAAGLPDSRQEAWKYTSLDRLGQVTLRPPEAESSQAVCPDVTAYPGHVLLFQDGQLACHGTYLSNQFAGTLRHWGDTRSVHEHLGRIAGSSALADLNLALWQDGARVYVPAGERLGMPIFAVYGAATAEAMLHPRTLAVVESGAEAVLVEHYLGQTDQTYWQNAVSEIVLAEGARLTHIVVVEEGPAASHTSLTALRLGRNSEYRALHIGLGGLLTRRDLLATLDGADAGIRIDAFDLADGRRHTDLHLRVSHRAPRSQSRITYRGLADDRARAIFDGHVVVEHGAHQTDARQDCKGLLLSRQAEIDAMPRLEIYADDVKCSHGASVGQPDPDALFYLRSRGLDAAAARRLLLEGFANEALGLLDDAHLRDWLMPRLLAALSRRSGEEVRS